MNEEIKATVAPNEKIGLWEKIAYGFGDLASNLSMAVTNTILGYFYSKAMKLDVGITGMIMMISLLFDGVTDVAMGFIMDKTKSKHGKARSWLLRLAVPFGIAMVLLVAIPNFKNIALTYVWVAVTYNLMTTLIYTAINIPYGALNSLMTRDQNERASINAFRMILAQAGSLLVTFVSLPLISVINGGQFVATDNAVSFTQQKGYIVVTIIYAVLAVTLFLVCFKSTKERVDLVKGADAQISFGKTLKLLFKNKYFLIICGVWVVTAVGMGLGMSVGKYYSEYLMGNPTYSDWLSAIQTVVAILGMTMVMPFIKRFGKRNVALVGSFISILAQATLIFINIPEGVPTVEVPNPANPTYIAWTSLIPTAIVKGLGMAPLMGTLFAMVADAIEFGQWKTGTRVEGMLYSATTFGAKAGAGVAVGIGGAILAGAGFVSGEALQSMATLVTIRNLYTFVPLIFLAIIPILYFIYDLDKKYPQIMADLKVREEANAAEETATDVAE